MRLIHSALLLSLSLLYIPNPISAHFFTNVTSIPPGLNATTSNWEFFWQEFFCFVFCFIFFYQECLNYNSQFRVFKIYILKTHYTSFQFSGNIFSDLFINKLKIMGPIDKTKLFYFFLFLLQAHHFVLLSYFFFFLFLSPSTK